MTTTADHLIPGRATAAGTARFRARFASLDAGWFRSATGLGVDLSSVGFGTYLGEADADTDRSYGDALRLAPTLGCNLIDTAVNYRCQFSERVIGSALHDLVAAGTIARDEIVVCTKGGYLAFDGPPTDARGWVEETLVEPGIIDWGDIVGSNVMQPRYIRHQLETSLRNLGLAAVDVYYLHNPESQLQGVPAAEFYRRVTACFEALEAAAADGLIGVYGVATWDAFRVEASAQAAVSIETLAGAARDVAGDAHHFKAVQMPFNLGMPEAFARATQPAGDSLVTALEAAARHGLTVFASGALMQGRLARLPAQIVPLLTGADTDPQRALQFARSAPGVTAALVGMKSTTHVRDNLALARRPPMTVDQVVALFA
jgi:aryl-alcohol dehydrogenase-like predicted oxidoreductase